MPNTRSTSRGQHQSILSSSPTNQRPHQGRSSPRHLQALILTANVVSSHNEEGTLTRIKHFSDLTEGKDAVLVFLLKIKEMDTGTDSTTAQRISEEGMQAFSSLQILLFNESNIAQLPLLPISNPSRVIPLLISYTTSLGKPENSNPSSPLPAFIPLANSVAPLHALLSSAAQPGPLPLHETNVLSDICGSWREVVDLASQSKCEQGQQQRARTAVVGMRNGNGEQSGSREISKYFGSVDEGRQYGFDEREGLEMTWRQSRRGLGDVEDVKTLDMHFGGEGEEANELLEAWLGRDWAGAVRRFWAASDSY